MAKIKNTLPPITTNTGGGTSIHNDLSGLNVGNYIHLTAIEKTKFDNLPNTFAPIDAEKNVNTDWNAISGDEQLLNKPSTFPPSIHTHLEADITDLDKYTQLEVDNLLDYKFNNPTGSNTQYLDGSGTPTTFPTIPSAFNPSEHDLEEFLNEGSDPYARQSEVGGSQNLQQTLNNGSTATFTHPLSNDTLVIEEVFDNSIGYVSKKSITQADGNITIVEVISLGNKSVDNGIIDGDISTSNISQEIGLNTTESKYNQIRGTQISDSVTSEVGSITYEIPTPKLNVDVVLRDPVIETSGTYTRATREWVTANPPTIVVDADDVTETATRVFVTPTEKAAITHSNRSTLDLITEAFTTTLKNTYDNAVSWISTNGTNVLNHLTRTDNPHSVTKSQVGLSNVDNTSDVNKPVSTAQATAIGLKVDKTSWIDISATSTIVGWSSFAQKFISYKITDGTLECLFYLEGTSNSTSITFTLPNNSAQGVSTFMPSGYNVNNGIVLTNSARIIISNASNVVNITRDFTGASYIGNGTKGVAGRIAFKI